MQTKYGERCLMFDGRFFRRKVEKSLVVSGELCSFAADNQ